jgi:hypothetical protein
MKGSGILSIENVTKNNKDSFEVINSVPEMIWDERNAAMQEIEARLYNVFFQYFLVDE